MAVEKFPDNRMLGHREIVDGKVPQSLRVLVYSLEMLYQKEKKLNRIFVLL